jgi:hypothetical protein
MACQAPASAAPTLLLRDFPVPRLNGMPVRLRAFTTAIAYNRFRPREKWSSYGAESADPVR